MCSKWDIGKKFIGDDFLYRFFYLFSIDCYSRIVTNRKVFKYVVIPFFMRNSIYSLMTAAALLLNPINSKAIEFCSNNKFNDYQKEQIEKIIEKTSFKFSGSDKKYACYGPCDLNKEKIYVYFKDLFEEQPFGEVELVTQPNNTGQFNLYIDPSVIEFWSIDTARTIADLEVNLLEGFSNIYDLLNNHESPFAKARQNYFDFKENILTADSTSRDSILRNYNFTSKAITQEIFSFMDNPIESLERQDRVQSNIIRFAREEYQRTHIERYKEIRKAVEDRFCF